MLMPLTRLSVGLFTALAVLTLDTGAARQPASPQDACRAPMPSASSEPNMFSPIQERDFGDAVAEQLEPVINAIDNDDLTAHLRRVGARLTQHLPGMDLQPQFILTDDASADAFALPGGRIYVSRPLVGMTRSEDELAAVMAHELGHLVARHHSIDVTRALRDILNVTALGDREDVRAKYHQLMDNGARKPRPA